MILLDTHAWLWWVARDAQLPASAAAATSADGQPVIAAITLWEVAMLVEKGRVELNLNLAEWLPMASSGSGVMVLPITTAIAVRTTRLGANFHGDPADRLIVGTALEHGLTVVTKDGRIRQCGLVSVVW